MRDTVYCLCDVAGRAAIAQSIAKMGADLQIYGPGYRLKQAVQFDDLAAIPANDFPSGP